jgi:hypothetical protein
MQLGEVVFGGVGSGLYGMLAFVIIAVFVAGLMVGRTPEYLGKKIVWVPLPLGPTRTLVGKVPGVEWLIGIPAEGLDYFASDTTYPTTNTTADLAGTGVSCPDFREYAPRLLDYMIAHPEFDSSAMI